MTHKPWRVILMILEQCIIWVWNLFEMNWKRTSQYSGFFKNGAVAADVGACSTLGKDVLEMGGNAVDATITTVLCNGG